MLRMHQMNFIQQHRRSPICAGCIRWDFAFDDVFVEKTFGLALLPLHLWLLECLFLLCCLFSSPSCLVCCVVLCCVVLCCVVLCCLLLFLLELLLVLLVTGKPRRLLFAALTEQNNFGTRFWSQNNRQWALNNYAN
jgi:hypothetical protein